MNETIKPSGAGSLSENQPIGSVNNWACVDEDTPDQNTFVRNFDTEFKTDLYTGANSIPEGSTINSVAVHFRVRGVQTQMPGDGVVKIKPVINESGVTTEGTEITPSTSVYTTYNEVWSVRPSDGNAWTLEDINALEFGISQRATASFNCPRTTQVYLVIDYN